MLVPLSRKIKYVSQNEIEDLFKKAQGSRVIENLIEMQNKVSDLHYEWLIKNIGRSALDMGQDYNSCYSPVLSFISDRIDLLDPKFKLNPQISSEETVNGYKLYDTSGSLYCYSDFIELKELFNDNSIKTTNFGDFMIQFDEIACSEWSKMNTTGDDWYVGFWKAEEGSEERKNAWRLTREQNARALFDLPYSKTFLLKTVSHGCSNRRESVRYSNFLCVWFERKLELMKNNKNIEIDEDALDNQYVNYKINCFRSLYPNVLKTNNTNDNWFTNIEGKYVNVSNTNKTIEDIILENVTQDSTIEEPKKN